MVEHVVSHEMAFIDQKNRVRAAVYGKLADILIERVEDRCRSGFARESEGTA